VYFVIQFINGLQIGAIYALIALGYTMVYGIVKLINFAHGDLMMVSSYFLLIAMVQFRLPLWVALPFAMLLAAILGVVIERLAYKPLRNASRLSALITAIGVSLLLQNAMMLIFSSTPRRFPDVGSSLPRLDLGGNSISLMALITVLAALVLMVVLQFFISRSKVGKAMRAVSEDMEAAQLMGIDVNKIISVTFAIGSALAAIAALLFVVAYPQVDPYLGAMPGIKAFIAAVLGGIGIIPGAMLGGFLLGLIEALTKAYIPSAFAQLADGAVFVVLILVLLFKPVGLLGRPGKVKL